MRPFRTRPSTVYWELTRACGQACSYCRVDAGHPLAGELGTPAALRVADQLVALGVHEVILSGGQPHRHPGWAAISRRLADGGVAVRMFVSGGWLDAQTLAEARAAGVVPLAPAAGLLRLRGLRLRLPVQACLRVRAQARAQPRPYRPQARGKA